jgi:hypothetical protein
VVKDVSRMGWIHSFEIVDCLLHLVCAFRYQGRLFSSSHPRLPLECLRILSIGLCFAEATSLPSYA